MMSIYQCDLYRGRRLADHLRRFAALVRSSVGDLSCSHLLYVHKEFRLVLSGSGPCFMSKDIGTGTLPFVVSLQTGSRVASFLNRFQCDIQLRGCVLGQMLPEIAKTIWSIVEEVLHCPDVIAWRQALIDTLYNAGDFRVLSVDGTMKIAHGAAEERYNDSPSRGWRRRQRGG